MKTSAEIVNHLIREARQSLNLAIESGGTPRETAYTAAAWALCEAVVFALEPAEQPR